VAVLERIVRHWPLKLLALAMAYAIWVSVVGESPILQDFNVPLEVTVNDETILTGPVPTTVTVRLRGPEPLLRRVDPLRLEMHLDLRDAPIGPRQVQLSAQNLLGAPRGIEVVLIEPDRPSFTLDRKARLSLPVMPSFSGRPPRGFAFYGSVVVPDRFEVEGPEGPVEALKRLRTDTISLDQRTSSFVSRVTAVPESPDIRVIDPRPVEVRVEVDESPVDVVMASVGVVLYGQAYESSVTPSTLKITVSGPPRLVQRLRPGQVVAVADLTELRPGPEPQDVTLRFEFRDVPLQDLPKLSVRNGTRHRVRVRINETRIAA
jgi:YbbR domain-containing protein